MTLSADLPLLPNLIDGKWTVPVVDNYGDVYNPSRGEIIARVPLSGAEQVDAAVQAAKKAFVSWSQTPALKRATIFFKYKALLEENAEALAQIITRENGKTLDEARGDLRRGIEVVDFALGIGHLSKGESVPQVADGIDGVTMREPLGVCAGITPFNFPAMVPMWMYPLAIACGNCFILKPSEKVPLTAIRLAELFQEAGLPEGVFNIVHGGVEVVNAICEHPGIASISFVGSSRIAAHVYAEGCRHGKRVQAGGGAKNFLVVMPDAEPSPTLAAIMGAAYGCAGQRCMAGSMVMGVGEAAQPLKERLVDAIDNLKLGDTSSDPGAQMGPVIDGVAQQRIQGVISKYADQNISLVRDGRQNVPGGGFFVGPTLFEGAEVNSGLAKEEVFGPVLNMLAPKTLEEALEWANSSAYGNGATIFTSSGRTARDFVRGIQCGMVGVNVGVPAAMALFPFSGWNQSFFGDLHVQGMEGVQFFTRQRVVLSRWDAAYKRTQGW